MAAALDDFVVASKLHVGDVVDFVRAIDAAAAPLPVLVARCRPRRTPRARAALRGRPRAGARRIQDEPPTPRRRVRAAMSRTRAVVALGVTLAVLGVGTAFGLRATAATIHDAPKPRCDERRGADSALRAR